MTDKKNANSLNLDVRFDQQAALYASQFMLNAGVEEVTLDCSSGVEVVGDQTIVPVHTRLALSWGAVERLHSLLHQTLAQRNKTGVPIPAPHIRNDAAKLPSFGETNV